MKVLHTIPGLSIHSGGPSTCTYFLLKGLNELGVQADVLTLSSASGEKIVGTDTFIKAMPYDAVSALLYSRNIKNYLRQHNEYDLYHANVLWTLPSHDARMTAQHQQKPFLLAPHGMLYPEALQVSSWKKKMVLPLFQQKDLERADCLQATCEAELLHIRNFGLKNPVAIVPNGLHLSVLPQIREKENSVRRFGFVGRFHRIKNIDLLLKAWIKLGLNTNEAELLLIGDGEEAYKQELKQLALSSPLKNITFSGFLNGTALEEMITSLDYQILPSKSENFGMVVPEALVHGVPVIASKGTPWKELETHHCGWWVESNITQLAETLQQALNQNEATRREMGAKGRRLVLENYLLDKVTAKMKRLYECILTGEKADFIHY